MTGGQRHGHQQVRVTRYPEGWVAWCSCGIGSPAKPTQAAASASLAAHVRDPFGDGRRPR